MNNLFTVFAFAFVAGCALSEQKLSSEENLLDTGSEDSGASDFDCAESYQVLTGASSPAERVWVETAGFVQLEYLTEPVNAISQGEPATLVLKVTARCAPMTIEGFVPTVVWTDADHDWLTELGANQTPAELVNLETGVSDFETSWSGDHMPNTITWGWNFISYQGFFAEEAVEYIDAYDLEAGESATYEFTFNDSAFVPVGESFNLSFMYLFWSESEGEHLVANTALEYMPDGGLDWTGEELCSPSAGNSPSVVYHVN